MISREPFALLSLLAQNPAEKTMVFVHHHGSMAHPADLLRWRQKRTCRQTGHAAGCW
jgi:hypothetical protein